MELLRGNRFELNLCAGVKCRGGIATSEARSAGRSAASEQTPAPGHPARSLRARQSSIAATAVALSITSA
jgi:hypothetical protein